MQAIQLILALGFYFGFCGAQAMAHSSDSVHIDGVKASGNGCPQGSFNTILSGDGQTLSILFSDFIVEQPGRPVKSCNLQLDVHLPAKISLSWYRTEHRGFVDTSGGANGELNARYILQGAGLDFEKTTSWAPQTVEAYTLINDSPGTKWTRCGGSQKLLVRTMIRLKGKEDAYNVITVDDQSQRVETTLRFAYRAC